MEDECPVDFRLSSSLSPPSVLLWDVLLLILRDFSEYDLSLEKNMIIIIVQVCIIIMYSTCMGCIISISYLLHV